MWNNSRPYEEYAKETFEEFEKIKRMSKELNAFMEPAEMILVGGKGSGKSAVVEAFLGHRFHGAVDLKRPLEIRLQQNSACETPRVTILRDSHLSKYDAAVEVGVEGVEKAVGERNVATGMPIYVTYEHARTLDVTLIDTPALEEAKGTQRRKKKSKKDDESETSADPAADQVAEAVFGKATLSLLSSRQRVILAVESAAESGKLAEALSEINPGFSRTLFIYTGFAAHLETLQTTAEVNRFLSAQPQQASWFVVTLPGKADASQDAHRERLAKLAQEDVAKLDAMQYDRMHQKRIGATLLRTHLVEVVWRMHRDQLPKLQELIGQQKKTAYDVLHSLRNQLGGLESYRLRGTMTTCAMSFLKDVERLIREGPTSSFGWTLAEELDDDAGMGPWLDEFYRPVALDAETIGIDGADVHLSGRQQFERLLKQFHAIADRAQFGAVRLDEVAVASDTGSFATYPQLAWAACDIAQARVRKVLEPLVLQLHERAVEILLQVLNVVSKIGQAPRRLAANASMAELSLTAADDSGSNIYDYPYFLHRVREIYTDLVERTAKTCKQRCHDEFLATKIVYWDFVQTTPLPKGKLSDMDLHDRKEACMDMARAVFNDLRARITLNCLLKHFSLLLIPLQADIWSSVQDKFSTLSDDEIAQLFEMEQNRASLTAREASVDADFRKLTDVEMSFMQSSNSFSHPR